MKYYADTSWWIAFLWEGDRHHEKAVSLFDHDPEADVLWTPWQRVEVFNGLHQLARQGHFERSDAVHTIRRLERDVRSKYWLHEKLGWTDAARTACEIAGRFGSSMVIRGMDLFHVAVALTVRVEVFLTFDEGQEKLARSAGLKIG